MSRHARSSSRRQFLAQASFAALSLETGSIFAQAAASSTVVNTPSGPLRGESAGGVRTFRGVPFAEPPVGDLRFRPTVPVKAWISERGATRFAPAAVQEGDPGVPQSEDCLYLNVWAPEGKGPFPVFAWFHGGSYTGGYAYSPNFNGANFARDGIVCITVAYRLGALGFLDMEPLLGASYAGSANNGLHDALAALEWIHKNVAAFGGDPARVTIAGESAGAKLTCTLMSLPAARPFFHQAISESGGGERIWSREESAIVSNGYGAAWTSKSGNALPGLQTATGTAVMEAQTVFLRQWPRKYPLRPEIDGVLLPQKPVMSLTGGIMRGKRLLIGTNLDESASFIGPHPAQDAGPRDLGNASPAPFAQVYAKYAGIYPGMAVETARIRSVTAEEYWVPTIRVADACVHGGGSVFSYRLDFTETSGTLKDRAFHGLDVGLVWGTPHANVDNAAAEAALGRRIHAAWCAFVRGEAPNAPGLPTWTPYRTGTRSTMILDTASRMEERPHEAELRLWDRLL